MNIAKDISSVTIGPANDITYQILCLVIKRRKKEEKRKERINTFKACFSLKNNLLYYKYVKHRKNTECIKPD